MVNALRRARGFLILDENLAPPRCGIILTAMPRNYRTKERHLQCRFDHRGHNHSRLRKHGGLFVLRNDWHTAISAMLTLPSGPSTPNQTNFRRCFFNTIPAPCLPRESKLTGSSISPISSARRLLRRPLSLCFNRRVQFQSI